MFSKGRIGYILLSVLGILSTGQLKSQDFQTIGVRLGVGSGVVYKSYLDDENAFELIAYNKEKGALLTGIYLFNDPVSSLFREQFFFHYGFGAHIGFYKEKEYFTVIDNWGNKVLNERMVRFPNLGFDVLGGIEYRFESYPLIVGFDFKPAINFFGPYKKFGSNFFDMGISFLYKF